MQFYDDADDTDALKEPSKVHPAHPSHSRDYRHPAAPQQKGSDAAVEIVMAQDLQLPSLPAPASAQNTLAKADRHGSAAQPKAYEAATKTPAGFEEVDTASLAALLGQDESMMCEIVFLHDDPPGAAEGDPLLQPHVPEWKTRFYSSN
jgi:hypothetical protein